jgi:Transposase IS66 family
VFFYSRNRAGEHPARHLAGYAGILQADAYAGFGADSGGSRSRIRDDVARHSDLMSLGVPR